jgi:SAM-dependent methyltransferase
MIPARQVVARILSDVGLLSAVDKLRFIATIARLQPATRRFVSANPNFSLPPKALAFDAYSAPDWDFYKRSGLATAEFLSEISKKYLAMDCPVKVFEWGCGPARVIRHLRATFGLDAKIYGSDYNEETIAWCRDNIPGVTFLHNTLQPDPPLPIENDFFDLIYSISVFTHLSESTSQRWIAELLRIVRPCGLLIITTQGDALKLRMMPDELRRYRTSGTAVRDKCSEGKKLFSAFHSPEYLRQKLFKVFEVLEHAPASFPFTAQDYWVLRRPP